MALILCRECGQAVSDEALTCPICGVPDPTGLGRRPQEQAVTPPTSRTSNTIAGLASFFVPGLGQLIQGRILAAVGHFVAASILWVIFMGWVVHLASAVGASRYDPTERPQHRSFKLTR